MHKQQPKKHREFVHVIFHVGNIQERGWKATIEPILFFFVCT